jgi:hypothetical protein
MELHQSFLTHAEHNYWVGHKLEEILEAVFRRVKHYGLTRRILATFYSPLVIV